MFVATVFALPLNFPSVQECDATGDAIKNRQQGSQKY